MSGDCGKRASKKETGARAMNVQQMIQYIRDYGSAYSNALLDSYIGTPKRTEVCEIMKSFPRGARKVEGHGPSASPVKSKPATPSPRKEKNKRIANMTVVNMSNFIKRKGTQNAKNALNNLGAKPPRRAIIRVMRSFNAGRARDGIKPARGYYIPQVPVPPIMSFPKTPGRKDPTARFPREKRARLVSPGTRAANKMAKKMFENAVHNYKRQMYKAVPVRKFNAVRILPKNKTSPLRVVNKRINMTEYTLNKNAEFRIKRKLCKNMPVSEINGYIKRVGLDPSNFKTKIQKCAAIAAERRIKPHVTKKREDELRKEWRKNITNNYTSYLNKHFPLPNRRVPRATVYRTPPKRPNGPQKRPKIRPPRPPALSPPRTNGNHPQGRVGNMMRRINAQSIRPTPQYRNALVPNRARGNNRPMLTPVSEGSNNPRYPNSNSNNGQYPSNTSNFSA